MDGMSFGWGAKSVGLSACLREWLREQLNIRAGRAGQVCRSSRPALSQTQGSKKKRIGPRPWKPAFLLAGAQG